MQNFIMNQYNKRPNITIVACVVLLSIISIIVLEISWFNLLFDDKAGTSNIVKFNAALVIILTAFLVCIAWSQLAGIKKVGEADFLFRIEERFGSEPIIKARSIIQRLYRESNNLNPGAKEKIHRLHIAKRIDEISKDALSYKEYTYLLNLLDFLETISYYANENKMITIDDIKNLMGPSMEFFFSIFLIRIRDRRNKYQNKKYYCEFHKIVKKLRKQEYHT